MPTLTCSIPSSLEIALERRRENTGASTTHIIQTALAQYLGTPLHTLFQVATSGSLVAGVYDGVVTVAEIECHGDFGLGTFAGLDGEMVVLDGTAYQVKGDGTVAVPGADAEAPFAVVTFFQGGTPVDIEAISSYQALKDECDKVRRSDNLFYAFRIEGWFRHIRSRAVSPPQPGAGLRQASEAQSEFDFSNLEGTLVGIWSPPFSATFSVPGYHFHFISADRSKGGHLLQCDGAGLTLRAESLDNFHLALPESASFLQADLSKDTTADLAAAEEAH
jgi:acetolactate decarboxylase